MMSLVTVQRILDEEILSSSKIQIFQVQFKRGTKDAARIAALALRSQLAACNALEAKTWCEQRWEKGCIYSVFAAGVTL